MSNREQERNEYAAITYVVEAKGCSREKAKEALESAKWDVLAACAKLP